MPEAPGLRVSVVFAGSDQAFDVGLDLPSGATVADAIDASRLRELRPDAEILADRIGVFSRRVAMDTPLRDGDRVEIYRPLKLDPKEARRRRARSSMS